MPDPDGSRRGALARLALVCLAFGVAFVLAEVALRAHAYARNGFTRLDDTFTVDAATGLRILRPGGRHAGISINSLGFRGPEIVTPKPAGTLRLAFLGASTTFCAEGRDDAATWPDLVVRQLQRTLPQQRVDYVNAGVPGYGIESIRKNLELRVQPHSPDVVVFYEAANSIAADTQRLAIERGILAQRGGRWTDHIIYHSRLGYLVYMHATLWRLRAEERAGTGHRLVLGASELEALGSSYRDRLIGLVRSAQRSARLVAVATFSPHLRRDNRPPDGSAEAAWTLYNSRAGHLTVGGLLDAYDAYNRAIRDAAAATGALMIDGEDEIPGDAEHYIDAMHFTDAGSRAMARRVMTRLMGSPALRRASAAAAAPAAGGTGQDGARGGICATGDAYPGR